MDGNDFDAEILPANIPPEHSYQIFRKDRKEMIDKRGGGVIVMVKPGLPAEECLDLDSNREIKWVKVKASNQEQILVGSYYREPKAKLENLDELDLSLNKVHNLKPYCNMKTFLGGDFNLCDIEWDRGCSLPGARDKSHCDKLIEITQNYNLEQINENPTRQGRVLDLLITSHPNLVQRHTVCPLIGLSDHDILSVTTSIKPIVNKKPIKNSV